ncbi:MAG: hypothetical protein OEW15_09575 [Nitrospirota bacterium]|nr:hypothetical protein [Nitrospirota bacterium]
MQDTLVLRASIKAAGRTHGRAFALMITSGSDTDRSAKTAGEQVDHVLTFRGYCRSCNFGKDGAIVVKLRGDVKRKDREAFH